jgi:5-hydroxyisourate hydrolase
MTAISTHVLDLDSGAPAQGVHAELFQVAGERRILLGAGITDTDGRACGLAGQTGASPGICRLVFAVGEYRRRSGEDEFLEEVAVSFRVAGEERLHIPLLLSPYGLSIYRGS